MIPWLLDKLLALLKFFKCPFKLVLSKFILTVQKFTFSSHIEKRYGFKPLNYMIKTNFEGKIYNKSNENKNIDKVFVMMKQPGKQYNFNRLISWKGKLLQPKEALHFMFDPFLPDEVIKELYSDYMGEFSDEELKSYLINKLPIYFEIRFELHNEGKVVFKKSFKLLTDDIQDKITQLHAKNNSSLEKEAKMLIRNDLEQLRGDIFRILKHRDGNKNVKNQKAKIRISITSFSEINGYYSLYKDIILSNLKEIDINKFIQTSEFFRHYKSNIETIQNRFKDNYSFITLGTMEKLVERLDKALDEVST